MAPRVATRLPLTATATFTPAASSHTAGDSVGVAQEFDLKAPTGAAVCLVSATLRIDTGTIETTAWRLHMFSQTPPSALIDTGDFTLATGDLPYYLGYIDFAQIVDMGATLFIETTNIQKQIRLTGTGFFAYLVNGTTLTPAAVAHIVTVQAVTI